MTGWICLRWPRAADGPPMVAAAHAAALREAGWTACLERPNWGLWRRGLRPPVLALGAGAGAVLGELHAHPGGGPSPARTLGDRSMAPEPIARALTRGAWGRYVALLGMDDSATAAVYRDPTGALEVLVWRLVDGTQVVADGVSGLPPGLSPPRLSIDWTRLALGLAEPVASVAEPPLRGFDAVGPGVLRPLGAEASGAAIWRPTDHTEDLGLGAEDAQQALRSRIDGCVAGLVAPRRRVLGEVSGGLDSAIVASAAVAADLAGRAPAWLNTWSPLGGADERAYARAVAERLGLMLREVELVPAAFADDDHDGVLDGIRPPLTAASREYDRAVRDLCVELGAEALLTGEGGDAVLFQSPSPLVFADLLRTRGLAALLSPDLAAHARWTRRSAWSLAAGAWRTLGRGPTLPRARLPLAGGVRAGPWRHPWMAQADGLLPAKQLHVLGVANAQVHNSDSRRRRVIEPLNPLLAQPVVELCLGLPTPLLTIGGRDRALARRAFADRLPDEVIRRRTKGDMALFYGRVVARGLPWLRGHLLGGCLAEAGVVDARALEQALTAERLAQAGGASAVLAAALTETWVRHWQRRVPDTPGATRDAFVTARRRVA